MRRFLFIIFFGKTKRNWHWEEKINKKRFKDYLDPPGSQPNNSILTAKLLWDDAAIIITVVTTMGRGTSFRWIVLLSLFPVNIYQHKKQKLVQAFSTSLIVDFVIMIKPIYTPLSVETLAKLWKLGFLIYFYQL